MVCFEWKVYLFVMTKVVRDMCSSGQCPYVQNTANFHYFLRRIDKYRLVSNDKSGQSGTQL